jgi:archaellum biogenesis ATPase FlaH
MIDKIVKNVETALEKLGENIIEKEEKGIIKKEDSSPKQPFPSIRYPTSEISLVDKVFKEEKIDTLTPDSIPEAPKSSAKEKKDLDRSLEEISPFLEDGNKIIEDSECHFIDIGRETRLIHLYGPPSGGKTTLALQSAIEILPKETYYIITSHSTSVLKRIKQMVVDDRWKDYPNLKQHFFPIQINNLKELHHQIEQIINFSSQAIGLVVIDHITDYVRGETHKEENRNILRSILEDLHLLTNKKKCKVIIINGFAFKGSAPAEDLIESFCDMTLKITNERKGFEIEIDDQIISTLVVDNSGLKNIHLNIYF